MTQIEQATRLLLRLAPAGAVVLAVLAGAVPCFAQDVPDVAQTPPVVEAPVVDQAPVPVPKPVATDNQMLHKYVWSTIGLSGAFSATLGSGLDQWKESPEGWGTGSSGYAKRWLSEYAESAIADGAKYAVAHFFHQDPSFYPCACRGFGRRLHHAVDSPFMGRKRDGTRVPSAASLAGFLTGNVVSSATWYPAELGARDGLKHAGISLVTKIAVDVVKEFWPRHPKK